MSTTDRSTRPAPPPERLLVEVRQLLRMQAYHLADLRACLAYYVERWGSADTMPHYDRGQQSLAAAQAHNDQAVIGLTYCIEMLSAGASAPLPTPGEAIVGATTVEDLEATARHAGRDEREDDER